MVDEAPTSLELTWTATDRSAVEGRLAKIGIPVADHALRWPAATIRFVEDPGAPDRLSLDGVTHQGSARPGSVASEPLDPTMPAAAAAGRAPAAAERSEPAATLLAIGWATVELDRAASEFPMASFEPATADPLLGAFVRRSSGDGRLLLLEPNTEGPLVATLVRWGEGPAALYLGIPAAPVRGGARAAAPGVLSAERVGPFGPSALLLGGQTAGPHVIVVRRPPDDSADPPFAGTIGA